MPEWPCCSHTCVVSWPVMLQQISNGPWTFTSPCRSLFQYRSEEHSFLLISYCTSESKSELQTTNSNLLLSPWIKDCIPVHWAVSNVSIDFCLDLIGNVLSPEVIWPWSNHQRLSSNISFCTGFLLFIYTHWGLSITCLFCLCLSLPLPPDIRGNILIIMWVGHCASLRPWPPLRPSTSFWMCPPCLLQAQITSSGSAV